MTVELARLSAARWPADAYDRARLPERVLQFGTGMLLRALPAALLDAANRGGAFRGRIVVVQSTPTGVARAINAQDGLFTIVERGSEGGAPVERTRLVGSISRALVAATDWPAVRTIAASPELRIIVSNVTEAGFRLDAVDERPLAGDSAPVGGHAAPGSFPAKLTDLLHARFEAAPDAPPLFVVPTELVDDNGGQLRAMVDRLAARYADATRFRAWIARRVRFCSSLVDRITTGAPAAEAHAALEARLGYRDALLTVAEPYALWAVECDPADVAGLLATGMESPGDGAEPQLVVARDIGRYRERKIRLLNGSHTMLAPLARLDGVRTVRDAVEHPRLGAFLRRVLYDEIVPSTDLPPDEARAFAAAVLDRFANPWLEHEWRVISTNETSKMRLRVVPSLLGYAAKHGAAPAGLALALAGYVRYTRCIAGGDAGEGTGWWRGTTYAIVDADLAAVTRHWRAVDPAHAAGPVPPDVGERLVVHEPRLRVRELELVHRLEHRLDRVLQVVALVDHVRRPESGEPLALREHELVEDEEQAVRPDGPGGEVVVAVLGVVEVEAAELPGPEQPGDDELDVRVRQVVPEVDEALGALAEAPGEQVGRAPVLDDRGVEGGLERLVLGEQAPPGREGGVDLAQAVEDPLEAAPQRHLPGEVGAVGEPDGDGVGA